VAVLLLQNTTKDGTSFRGRGEWADRSDIIYEVRDATGFVPSVGDAWWEKLPEGGETEWAARATRRKGRTDYRLAFIPSKFRLGQEPEPFCLEINLPSQAPWTLRDVTDELRRAAKEARTELDQAKRERLEGAADALRAEIAKRESEGNPLLKSTAEGFLRNRGLSQAESRRLLNEKTGKLWRFKNLPGGRKKGRPKALFICGHDGNSITTTELQNNGIKSPLPKPSGNEHNSVDPPQQSNGPDKPMNSHENSGPLVTPSNRSGNGKRRPNYRVKAPSERPPGLSSRPKTTGDRKDGTWEEDV
jgi:hypothetical protein